MAHVVSRSSLEVVPSANTPDFPEPSFKVCTQAEVDSVESVATTYRIIGLDDLLRPMTDEEITSLRLTEYKLDKMKLVNAETKRRIDLGFTHAGKLWSTAVTTQLNLLGAKAKADEWAPPDFPVTASTKDDLDALDFSDGPAIKDWFNSGAAYVKAKAVDGNVVKKVIRAATSKGAVDAAAASYLAGGPP